MNANKSVVSGRCFGVAVLLLGAAPACGGGSFETQPAGATGGASMHDLSPAASGGATAGTAETGGVGETGGALNVDASIPDTSVSDASVPDAPSDCDALKLRIEALLTLARICSSQHTADCTQSVAGVCCPEYVASPTSAATLGYLSALQEYAVACLPMCPSTCPSGPGKCSAQGSSASCVRGTTPT